MKHRHLDTTTWTAAAIDSVLERGDLKDWQELFSAVREDDGVADLVLHVARHHDLGGASILAAILAERLRPQESPREPKISKDRAASTERDSSG